MLLYIFIITALLIALLISVTDCGDNIELKNKQSVVFSRSIYKGIFVFFIGLFWFLTAFRSSNIGNDTISYLNYYEQIATQGVNPNLSIELGYQYFCLLLSKVSSNPYFLFATCATLCYTLCGIYIYKYSNNILYSVILLFCVAFSFFTSGLRQAIAMVIVLFAYQMIKKQKKLIPIILIGLASLFHISSLLVLFWFVHKYIPKKPIVVVFTAVIIAVLAASGGLNSILTSVLQEYQSYFEAEQAGTGWLGITYYYLRAFVFYLFIYNAYKNNLKEHSLIVSNSVLLLITVCFGFSVNLFNRASSYFLLITIVDIPNAFNSGKIKDRNIWMIIMGVIMLAYFLVTLIVRPEWNTLYPYQFYWN